MPDIFRIGYIDLATPSLEEAVRYYGETIGATVTESGGGSAFLSLGLDHHNIALHQAERPAVAAIGLQITRALSLDDVEKKLREMGIAAEAKMDTRPGVGRILEVAIGGHVFHLFQSNDTPAPGFALSGIVPLRLGHIALLTIDAKKVITFLTEALGFWTTDWFEEQVTFLTCNRDHHVLNIIEAPFSTLHHIAFELRGREHQIQAMDQLAKLKRPIVWGPSRHTAGHNFATYHYGADNALIELFTDMDVFLPDLASFEPRPWHEDLPQTPKHWNFSQMTAWETRYEFDFLTVAFGM